MPIFGHNNNTTNQTQAGPGGLSHTENDPMYNNERGVNQDAANSTLAGYMVPGVGLVSEQQAAQMQAINYEHKGAAGPLANNGGVGMGPGHQSNAIPQGGQTQGANAPVQGDPMYDNQRGSVAKRGAEGATLGGLGGHEGHHGHTGRDAAIAGAGGAAYEHEHNKHHHNAQNGNTGGVGAGGISSNNQQHHQIGQSNAPDLAEAKKLEKSAKMEKIIGTLTGNTAKKEDALEKKAEAAAIREQVRHVSNAEELEAQAQRARGVAVGMGAHPSVAGGRSQGIDSSAQSDYGAGQGAPVGGGLGGGRPGVL